MKINIFYLILLSSIIYSCKYSEEDHIPKSIIREHLKNTLHNPKSFDELEWNIDSDYQFKKVDSTDINSPLIIDYDKTFKHEKENGLTKFIELTYRAENGYGALRKYKLYAIYFESIQIIQFENISYSIDLKSYLPKDNSSYKINPKRQFLQNQYYRINSGKGTYENFINEYPEFKIN